MLWAGTAESRGLTSKIEELSSGSFTGDTSMKLNAFHCWFCQLRSINRKSGRLTDVSAISARHSLRCVGGDDAVRSSPRWRSGHLVPDVDLRLPGRRSLLLSVTPND
jgi:hypothetical protein